MQSKKYFSKKTISLLIIFSAAFCAASVFVLFLLFFQNRFPATHRIWMTFDVTAQIVVCIFLGGCAFDRLGNEVENAYFSFFLFAVVRMLFYDFIIFIINGRTTTVALVFGFLFNTFYYLVNISMLQAFLNYMCNTLVAETNYFRIYKKILRIYYVLVSIISIINIWIPLVFSIEDGYYQRGPVAPLLFMILIFGLIMVIPGVLQIPMDRRKKTAIISYIIIPIIFSLFQYLLVQYAFFPIGVFIATCIIYVHCHVRQNWNLQRRTAELEKQKTAIMLSQIQPHFLYNSLSSIAALCTLDPEKAKETTLNFTKYLRANLNSLTNDNTIPFEDELNHTKAYLAIEEIRFNNRIKVEFDITVSNFPIPSLTLQPIAENAVKHGICKKESGGTLRISTAADDDSIVITVADDGIGFNLAEVFDDGREHIGIKNVETRLRDYSNGHLIIESTPGEGTVAKIVLPRKKATERV